MVHIDKEMKAGITGHVSNPIEDFLREYEELADDCCLTSQQKVETIICYIPVALQDLWKLLEGYAARDWVDFKMMLEDTYDGPSACSRYSTQKLHDFVRHSAKMQMNEEEEVLQYYRQFLGLSNPLKRIGRLTDEECNKAFWLGFHPQHCAEMYARLIAKYPDQPFDICFDYLDIYKVARATFSGNNLLDSELDEHCDELRSLEGRHLEHAQERWPDQEEHNVRRVDPNHCPHNRRRHLSPIDFTPQDAQHQHSPLPEAKTKVT